VNVFFPPQQFVSEVTGKNWTAWFASIFEINAGVAGMEEKFLHEGEIDVFDNIRSKLYRESWFAGRILAKNIYTKQCVPEQNIDGKDIQVVSRNSLGRSIAPRLLLNGNDTCFMFSLSHVADRVMVVVPASRVAGIGCDLVYQGTITPGIVKTFFHDAEINDLGSDISSDAHRDTLWAVKEAAYKSCNEGESFQPRQWLAQKMEGNRFFCRHCDLNRQLSAEVETFILDDYIAAVAKKSSWYDDKQKPPFYFDGGSEAR